MWLIIDLMVQYLQYFKYSKRRWYKTVVNKPTCCFRSYSPNGLRVGTERKITDNVATETAYYYSAGDKKINTIVESDSNRKIKVIKHFYSNGRLKEKITDKVRIMYYKNGKVAAIATEGDNRVDTRYNEDGKIVYKRWYKGNVLVANYSIN